MLFLSDSKGTLDDPDELEGVEVAEVELAEVVVEPELITVVRSSVNVPEAMCC
jgi:hypothetical protein